mgnify:CR=1 FL=1
MAAYKGTKVVVYHRTWAYFNERFGLVEFADIEPKPGIAPSASHIRSLIGRMKGSDVKVILMESFYPRKFPDTVARQTGAKVVIVPTSAGAAKGAETYIGMFDKLVGTLEGALK